MPYTRSPDQTCPLCSSRTPGVIKTLQALSSELKNLAKTKLTKSELKMELAEMSVMLEAELLLQEFQTLSQPPETPTNTQDKAPTTT